MVEKIITKKRVKNKKDQWLYYVKWDGFPENQNTWEPIENFTNVKELLHEFEAEWTKNQSSSKDNTNDDSSLIGESKINKQNQ